MPDIPVFCDTCGTPFRSGIFIENSSARFINTTCGPCPNCGGVGTMSDVVINATQDAIRILFQGSDASAQLERLRSLIERAQQRQLPPDELVAELEHGNSMWQGLGVLLSQLLVPKDSGQFYGFLALLLAIWPLLQQPKEELTPEKVATIVEAAVQQSMAKAAPVAVPSPLRPEVHKIPRSLKKKPGRNDPCSCGSDKKYKRCCGDLARR